MAVGLPTNGGLPAGPTWGVGGASGLGRAGINAHPLADLNPRAVRDLPKGEGSGGLGKGGKAIITQKGLSWGAHKEDQDGLACKAGKVWVLGPWPWAMLARSSVPLQQAQAGYAAAAQRKRHTEVARQSAWAEACLHAPGRGCCQLTPAR